MSQPRTKRRQAANWVAWFIGGEAVHVPADSPNGQAITARLAELAPVDRRTGQRRRATLRRLSRPILDHGANIDTATVRADKRYRNGKWSGTCSAPLALFPDRRRLLKLRRNRRVSYYDITDGTRWITAPTTYDSVEDALRETARSYRRALWSHTEHRLQVFSEKDAISGVILPITDRWDVPLGVLRGYVSETFAWQVARSLHPEYRHVLVQLGDHDPSGVGAWADFSQKVAAFTDAVEVEFIRLAVTPNQIELLNLPTRPTKRSDTRAKNWEGGSVEVDAIPAQTLRTMLEEFIALRVDRHQLAVLEVAEADERRILERLAGVAS